MSETGTIEGGCLCGQCRYACTGAPINIRACHCRRCQKATGSSFYARLMAPLASVRISGPVQWYDGGAGIRRGFCGACGSTLFSERASAGTIGLALGSLDDPDAFRPSEHIWTSDMQRWLCLDDGLPQHAEGPTA